MEEDNTIKFFHLCEGDLQPIIKIENEIFPTPWTYRMLMQEIKNPESHFYVCKKNNDTIVGYAGFWKVIDEAHITTIGVSKPFQGKGYGKFILKFLLKKIRDLSVNFIYLEVRSRNKIAMNLYEGFGFIPLYIRKNYYTDTGDDAIIMALSFDKKQS